MGLWNLNPIILVVAALVACLVLPHQQSLLVVLADENNPQECSNKQLKFTSFGVEIAPGVVLPWISNGIGNQSLWLERGGRSMDTAYLYGDDAQRAVGEAVRSFDGNRSQLFVTTKVMCCPTNRCHQKTCGSHPLANNPRAQLEHSLEVMNLSHVDLLLLHFPCSAWDDTIQAWRALEQAQREGLARAIGVSNFNATLLQQLVQIAEILPTVNQCGYSIAGHPAAHDGKSTACQEGSTLYGSDDATVEMSHALGIAYQAYSPLGRISKVNVLQHESVQEIAESKGATTAQIALQWLLQKGIPAVSASNNPLHIDQVMAVMEGMRTNISVESEQQAEESLELSTEEMKRLTDAM